MPTTASVRRLSIGLAAGALLPGLAAISVVPLGAAIAAEASAPVTFADCEVRKNPYEENTKISDDIAWTTSVRLNVPTPLPTQQSITAEAELGALPAALLPEPLTSVEASTYLTFVSPESPGSPLKLNRWRQYLGAHDGVTPIKLEEIEYDTHWADAGVFSYQTKAVEIWLSGRNAADEAVEYSFACDQVVAPTTLLTVAAYDLNAAPELTADPTGAGQGSMVRLTGRNLLAAAPTTPPAAVAVTIGGESVGAFPLDQAGGFSAVVRVPDFVTPGAAVQVRAANGPKVATTALAVTATKGALKVSPGKAKPGKKLTLKGSRFKPGEKVKLTLKGGKGAGKKAFSTTVKAGSTGSFTKRVKLKRAAKGGWKAKAVGASSKRGATKRFTVR